MVNEITDKEYEDLECKVLTLYQNKFTFSLLSHMTGVSDRKLRRILNAEPVRIARDEYTSIALYYHMQPHDRFN